MSYPIHESWTSLLRDRPETGMGYQILEVTVSKGTEHIIVLNGTRALELQESPRRFREGADQMRKQLVNVMLVSERKDTTFRVLRYPEAVTKGLFEARAYATGQGPATEASPEQSDPDEEFLRFSAFADDIRILADGSVVPGTHVTTRADGEPVKTGKDASSGTLCPIPIRP